MKIIANLGYNWWDKKDSESRAKALVMDAINAGVHGIAVPFIKADTIFRDDEKIAQAKKFEVPPELLYDIRQEATERDLDFVVTTRHPEAVDYLEQIGVHWFHVQNGDIQHAPLLKRLAEKKVYLSTGYASFKEVDDASILLLGDKDPGDSNLVLLHSTGRLPTPANEAQIGRILDLAQEFFPLYVGLESFLSDPLLDYVAMAFKPSVIIRKLDLPDKKGLDTHHSIYPKQLKQLVDVARAMHQVNNPVFYYEDLVEGDLESRAEFMRCEKSGYLLPPDD